MSDGGPYGVIGIFATPKAVTAAAQQFRTLGFHALEAYTPYSVDGLDAAMRPDRPHLAAAGDLCRRGWRRADRLPGAVLGRGGQLSAQCRRAALQ